MAYSHTSWLNQLHIIHVVTRLTSFTHTQYIHITCNTSTTHVRVIHLWPAYTLSLTYVTHNQTVSLRYLFPFLSHVGSLGGPGQPLWASFESVGGYGGGGGGQKDRAWTPVAGERRWPVASRLAARKLYSTPNQSGPFADQVIRPLPDSA